MFLLSALLASAQAGSSQSSTVQTENAKPSPFKTPRFSADRVERVKDDPPAILTVASRKPLDLPGFSAFGFAQCDAEGNLFYHSGYFVNDPVVLKISIDGSHTLYTPQGEGADHVIFVSYSVNRDGKLYLLTQDREAQHLQLYSFGDDPNSPARINLDLPDEVAFKNISGFVALEKNLVFFGSFTNEKVKSDLGRSFVLQFDVSGKLLRKSFENVKDESHKEVVRTWDPTTKQGDDGLVYSLQQNNVVVRSISGEKIRSLPFETPRDYQPFDIYVAKGRVAVVFAKHELYKPMQVRFQLLDSSSGESLRTYEPSQELKGHEACFTGDQFSFLGMRDDKSELEFAPAN
jgi:hypothetical protein